ncbi:MAG: hypothetical protein KAS11_02405 [Candidatus Aenigmarchaeota archaeon]|nr:hypothetical protein [Candidatus Aenigmarchaeota archaeon]
MEISLRAALTLRRNDLLMFEKDKDIALSKLLTAKDKGEADALVSNLVDAINESDSYYTTSSCSGRIVVAQADEDNKKSSFSFLGKWHEAVTLSAVEDAIGRYKGGVLWFKFEPMILHVCCRDIDSASRFLETVYRGGFKRSGVYQLKGKIMVEVHGTSGFSVPAGSGEILIVNDKYLGFLVDFANLKMRQNREKIRALESVLKKG